MRDLIATHNSATGEKGYGLLSWLVTPFARCQRKTIVEQYKSGCRMFDIRVRYYKGNWRCAHGLWVSRKRFLDIFADILTRASFEDETCYVSLTYEGRLHNELERENFKRYAKHLKELFWLALRKKPCPIVWGPVAAKYTDRNATVDWQVLIPAEKDYPPSDQGFLPLDGHHWQTLLPIPWLWHKLYKPKHRINTERFTYVDFL